MIVESYEDVINLSGALRSNYWDTLHTAISLMLKRHPTGVIIDCSAITEVTPEGAATFRDVMEFIHNHDARVIVAAVPEHVKQVLRGVSQVRSQLAVAGSVDEARRSLDFLLEEKPKGRRTLHESSSKMLVYLTGHEVDREAMRVAQQLAQAREAEVHVAYIVIVPRDLPLTAPLPKEEAIAAAAIDRSKNATDPKQTRITPHLERGRDIASAIEEVLREIHATLLVLPIPSPSRDGDETSRFIRSVMAKITEEVILVRGKVVTPVAANGAK